MASKTFASVFTRSLFAREFYFRAKIFPRRCAKKFFSVHSSGTSSTGNFAGLLENVTVQKYFKFIEESDSFLKNMVATHGVVFDSVIELINKKKRVEVELQTLSNMNSENDKELENLVEEEKQNLMYNLQQIKYEILENVFLICNKDSNDDSNTEVQIIPAVGGDEAKLFAEELYQMYLNYVSYKNWECVLAELKTETRGGYILLSGNMVFNCMKHEAGVHRVQRIPATEKSGRTHTSTCSVAVLRKPKCSEIILNSKDLIIETTRSSGPGGQNVNKLESCVKVKHIPTGITTECQDSRYQYDNKKGALEKLKNILYERQQQKINSERKTLKKEQVGTNDYSDKIRTYNYNQNRVTDHRINYSMHNLLGFLSGGKDLDNLISKVGEFKKREILLTYFENVLNSVDYKNFAEMNLKSKTKPPKELLS